VRANPQWKWVVSIAIPSVLLLASLVVLLPPALRAWTSESAATYEALLRAGVPDTIQLRADGQTVSEDDYVEFLTRYAPEPMDADGDPWLFAGLVIGYLRLHNVPLWDPAVAAMYSTETRDWIVVGPSDTWASLARTYAGDESLWPLLLLLNRDWVTRRGLTLDVGRRIMVPLVDRLDVREEDHGER